MQSKNDFIQAAKITAANWLIKEQVGSVDSMAWTLVKFIFDFLCTFYTCSDCSIRVFPSSELNLFNFCIIVWYQHCHWLFNYQKALLWWSVNHHTKFQVIPVRGLPYRHDRTSIFLCKKSLITSWTLNSHKT